MAGSYIVHGERILDDDASTPTALTLFNSGSVVERTLLATEKLHITDVLIITETAGDVQLYVDTAAAGKYLVDTKTAAGVPIVIQFRTPYTCLAGTVPKFVGVSSNRNLCTIQGFITEA